MLKKKSLSLALWLAAPNLLLAGGVRTQGNELVAPLPPSTTQPTQVITPAVAPEVIDRVNVTLSGDFIWWKTYMGGLEYAISGISDGGVATAPSIVRGKVKKPPFSWAPGLKLTLGTHNRIDDWNAVATYTGLFNEREHTSVLFDATKGLSSNAPIASLPSFPFGKSSAFAVSGGYSLHEAKCSWRQKFNVLDIELARNFFISKTMTMRPHFGLKLSWIEEKFDIIYKMNNNQAQTTLTQSEIEMKQRQWGIGVRGGLNAIWHITKEFGIYGDLAATTLWSSFRTHLDNILTQIQGPNPGVPFGQLGNFAALNANGRLFEVIPVYELGLGLEYMHWFNNDTCLFFARAGWEEQIWCEFNQFVFPLDRLHGDLTLHGLDIRLGFTF